MGRASNVISVEKSRAATAPSRGMSGSNALGQSQPSQPIGRSGLSQPPPFAAGPATLAGAGAARTDGFGSRMAQLETRLALCEVALCGETLLPPEGGENISSSFAAAAAAAGAANLGSGGSGEGGATTGGLLARALALDAKVGEIFAREPALLQLEQRYAELEQYLAADQGAFAAGELLLPEASKQAEQSSASKQSSASSQFAGAETAGASSSGWGPLGPELLAAEGGGGGGGDDLLAEQLADPPELLNPFALQLLTTREKRAYVLQHADDLRLFCAKLRRLEGVFSALDAGSVHEDIISPGNYNSSSADWAVVGARARELAAANEDLLLQTARLSTDVARFAAEYERVLSKLFH